MRPRIAILALVIAASAALTMACEDIGPGIVVSPQAQNLPAVLDANGCSKDAARKMKETVEPIITRFNETTTEATAASGSDQTNLPAAIEELRALRAEFAALEVADCARRAHGLFLAYIDLNVTLYESIRDGASGAPLSLQLQSIIATQVEPEAAWSVVFQKADAE